MSKHLSTTEVTPIAWAPSGRKKYRSVTQVFGPGSPRRVRLDGQVVPIGRDAPKGLEVEDGQASRQHCELRRASELDVYQIVDKNSSNGTFLNTARIQSEVLSHGSVIRAGASLFVYAEIELEPGVPPDFDDPEVAPARAQAESLADLVAESRLPVLVLGPSGAGKELISKRIHDKSGRPGSLVSVNCSTFNRELLGSELFGHVRGAFSGALQPRAGLFQEADRGTLFLDEIADLPPEQQPALLRALQENRIRPVGSDRELEVDVRVVAATHRDIGLLREQGGFRGDLFQRLAGAQIPLPGLDARREEILPLFFSFLGSRPPTTIVAAEAMLLYGWPGNVRELKHSAERIRLLLRTEPGIDVPMLAEPIRAALSPVAEGDTPSREALVQLLERHEGSVSKVARELGKHRQQVYRWLKAHGIDAGSYRGEP